MVGSKLADALWVCGMCLFCYLHISLTSFDLSEVKVINKAKVISSSRSFQGEIVSV